MPSTPRHVIGRLSHPHYAANTLLCLPIPVLLLTSVELDRRSSSLLALAPLLLVIQLHGINGFGEPESIVESATGTLRLFNLVGLICFRGQFGNTRLSWSHVAIYVALWMLASFFFPQPGYLGPTKATVLTTEEFDDQVLIVPPPTTLRSDSHRFEEERDNVVSAHSDSDEPTIKAADYERKRNRSNVYHVVLFHVDWSRRSRELEIVVNRLSWEYTSPTLRFHILTPDKAPSTFYDQDLVPTPRNFDLPVIKLFHRGLVVSQLPQSVKDVVRERRGQTSRMKRSEIEQDKLNEIENDDDDEEEIDSDEEREAVQETEYRKYKWNRSAASIESAFKLKERSGIV
ncbi:hypothetical protein ACM66B_002320 [Microbotryomycetes sp. NB124-2]